MSLAGISLSSADRAAFASAFDLLSRDGQIERWRDDPVAWVEERLGEHVWSRQAEAMRAVARHPLVAVRSAHGVGKTHLASRLVAWWLSTRPVESTFVVTTAPTAAQVRAILWRYITQVHAKASLVGRVTQAAEWKVDDRLVAYGRKPADHSESAFQGIHAEHMLIVLDEACGIPKQLWVAADSLATGADSHLVAIGNPDSTSSHFHTVCTTEPGWHRIHISALHAPSVTGEPVPEALSRTLVTREWIDDKRLRWGETSPLYKAKVLGEFADDEDGLIPLSWVTAAQQRWHDWNDRPDRDLVPGERVLGVDVALGGEDLTAVAARQGDVVRSVDTWAQLDTIGIANLVKARLDGWSQATAAVDAIGVGAGVLDVLRNRGAAVRPFVASAGTKAKDSTGTQGFLNLRAGAWWHLRELLDPALGATLALPPDDELAADLTAPRWEPRTGGKIFVESKDDIRKRIGRSTDRGDAVVMACWSDTSEKALAYLSAISTVCPVCQLPSALGATVCRQCGQPLPQPDTPAA